ncbi:unnamed protein product [Tuber melanosporum]|uniref:(Perigord truffle) hypothetical protein n=1 Tax=Tuber melanosporum (strain Mel28) TaxID=656061 RepID=D5G9P8_TUBMM|nr:uncharacterized protein GSTUM_00005013001 [Tuber melanosporum]CAZ81241.1 unnamed protein product [Tuber melanosporum]
MLELFKLVFSSFFSLGPTSFTSCCRSLTQLDLSVLLPRSTILAVRLGFVAGLMPALQLLNGLES